MLIDFFIEIFSIYLRKYIPHFQKEILSLIDWIKQYPIPPKIYKVDDLSLYKYQQKSYAEDLDEDSIKEFDCLQYELSQKKVDDLTNIYKNNFKIDFKYEKDLDLSDFRFMIGDIIYYDEKEAIVLESLDEMIKIKINENNNIQDKKYNKESKRVEMWIETDCDKIKIKQLNNGATS